MKSKICLILLGLLFFPSGAIFAEPAPVESGSLTGLFLDESGSPLPGIIISIVNTARENLLPILARTNVEGMVRFSDLATGLYKLDIKSADFRTPSRNLIKIFPNRTITVTLVLQKLAGFDEGIKPNLGIKALLRSSSLKRLIFRDLPDYSSDHSDERIFDRAVFQLSNSSGLGGDSFSVPGDSWSGITSSFAAVNSLGSAGDYIFSGQLNSGQDSMWRLKNTVELPLSENNQFNVSFGYGRMSFDQPSLNLLSNPGAYPYNTEYTSAPGSLKLINLSMEEQYRIASFLSFTLGTEITRYSGEQIGTLVTPEAKLTFSPWENTLFEISSLGKRPSKSNTIQALDGRRVSMASPLRIVRFNDQTILGSQRYNTARIVHSLDRIADVELAYFNNRLDGGCIPVFAVSSTPGLSKPLNLGDGSMSNHGMRLSLHRDFLNNFRGGISLIRGYGPGFNSGLHISSFEQLSYSTISEDSRYQAVAAQLEAYIPRTQTHITALVKFIPGTKPLYTVDPIRDVLETGNEGVNLFIRQIIPLPGNSMPFSALSFLSPRKIEVLLDIRNLMDNQTGQIQTDSGTITLLQNPRSIRGGISFNF
jgi:hypothetical protein